MGCTNPLRAKRVFDEVEGKYKIKFCMDNLGYDLLIPCGQCLSCRIQKSREWANRLMLELKYHDSAYFLTLTYNNDHARPAADANGEVCDWLTLRKSDFQLFMKRLRKAVGNEPEKRLRFYACGEYGTETFRPHYHAIVFNLHLDDLQFYKKSELGFSYYTSEFLNRVWSEKVEYYENGEKKYRYEPIGYVIVGEVNWETCAYTARYVSKKLTGDEAKYYDEFGLEHPFSLMSRKPGIAAQYFEDHKDEIYQSEFINISTPKGGLKFRPPRYFDKKIMNGDDFDAKVALENDKEHRSQMADHAQKIKLQKTSLTFDEQLAVEERSFANKIKQLRRNLV